jgi:hypothetical protein
MQERLTSELRRAYPQSDTEKSRYGNRVEVWIDVLGAAKMTSLGDSRQEHLSSSVYPERNVEDTLELLVHVS